MTEERAVSALRLSSWSSILRHVKKNTRKRKRAPGKIVADPHSQPRIETLPPSSPLRSPRPLGRLTRQRPRKARSDSPDPIENLFNGRSRTASPEPNSPSIAALGHRDSSFTIAASSDFDELPSSEPGTIESEAAPLTIEQLLRRITGKPNLKIARSRKSSNKRRRLSGPEPQKARETPSTARRKGKNADARPVGFSDRLLMAAATSGVELADDASCLPPDGRKPLPLRRVEVDDTIQSSRYPLRENRRAAQPGSSRKKAPFKADSKPKPLDLVPLEQPFVTRKLKSGNKR
ncbi:hypothetical protein PENSPDRAFT_690777 [Peniophora sp. CONT]|nr:hypothetical protein PENSPDRAFT_690777 [Peniophora sp. CONT]